MGVSSSSSRTVAGRLSSSSSSSSSLRWEEAEKRLLELTGSVSGLPSPESSIFIRRRKRVRLRRSSGESWTPVYRLSEEGLKKPSVEVCVVVGDAEGAVRAAEGGAQRVDLLPCSGGELRAAAIALSRCSGPPTGTVLYAHLAMPNGRDWRLDEWGKLALKVDVQMAKAHGASGVVLGALDAAGAVDVDFLQRLVRTSRPLKFYLARDAFEATPRDAAVLDRLAAAGLHGLHAPLANAAWGGGKDDLAKLVHLANGRLNVVAHDATLTVHNALKLAAYAKLTHVLLADPRAPLPIKRDHGRGDAHHRMPTNSTPPCRRQRSDSDSRPASAETTTNIYSRPRIATFVGMGPSRSSSRSR